MEKVLQESVWGHFLDAHAHTKIHLDAAVRSLVNLVDNLAEGTHKTKCKYRHNSKKCKMCRIKYKDCECCLECKNIIDDLLLYKCLYCNKNYEKNYNNLINLLIHLNFLTSMSISLFCLPI